MTGRCHLFKAFLSTKQSVINLLLTVEEMKSRGQFASNTPAADDLPVAPCCVSASYAQTETADRGVDSEMTKNKKTKSSLVGGSLNLQGGQRRFNLLSERNAQAV